MSDIWDMVFSPWGLAAYAGFWALKLMFGAWLLRRAMRLLPVPAQLWAEDRLGRLRPGRRKTMTTGG